MIKNQELRLASVVGGYVKFLPHLIEHYKKLGVINFDFALHGLTLNDPNMIEAKNILNEQGITPVKEVYGPWHEWLNPLLYRELMMRYPENWFIVCDQDEFQLFSHSVFEIIQYCEVQGYDYVEGCLLDRFDLNGKLVIPPLYYKQLAETYPVAAFFAFPALGAYPIKVCLTKGKIHLKPGQHGTLSGEKCPREEIFIQVHHFKYTPELIKIKKIFKENRSSGKWQKISDALDNETQRLLEIVCNNTINIKQTNYLWMICNMSYSDYSFWNELTKYLMNEKFAKDVEFWKNQY